MTFAVYKISLNVAKYFCLVFAILHSSPGWLDKMAANIYQKQKISIIVYKKQNKQKDNY